ncbi:class I SAM-dependent methyltransferase, partial [Mycolicibacterium vaccae]|nr:class I SAM-dependent methyltransferase [Mycolicibacterium vaccae]
MGQYGLPQRYIADKLNEALGDIDAVVILGADWTLVLIISRSTPIIPIFEVDQNHQYRPQGGDRAPRPGRTAAVSPVVPMDFERDDLLTTLAEHGYQANYRTFFIWEGVTQYLTEDAVRATLEGLRPCPQAAAWYSHMSVVISSMAPTCMAPARCIARYGSV